MRTTFRISGGSAYCAACGAEAIQVSSALYRCPVCSPAADKKSPPAGLGDLVAAGLKRIGITEDRVKAATGLKDCGCAKRRQALNDIGAKYLGIGKTPVDGK